MKRFCRALRRFRPHRLCQDMDVRPKAPQEQRLSISFEPRVINNEALGDRACGPRHLGNLESMHEVANWREKLFLIPLEQDD